MQKDIKQTWELSHDAATVWEFLTRQELIQEWLMENNFQPVVGHKFQFHTRPKIKMGFDGHIYCEVLEVLPMQRLSYSWRGGPGNGKITLDSVVTWTLTPSANGTTLILEHKGFKGLRNYLPYIFMNEGWRSKIRKRFTTLLNNAAMGPQTNH